MRASLLLAGMAISGAATAVDFGVMETAVPIAKGHFKMIGYPLAVHSAEREQDVGVSIGVGYGLSERWDAEAMLATYDDITYVGTDLEYTFLDLPRLDMSLIGGVHHANLDFGEQRGADLTYVVSYALSQSPEPPPHARFDRLAGGAGFTLYAALDAANDEVELERPTDAMVADSHSSVHLVPGLQYRLSHHVDILAEVGVGLNDAADDYVGVGTSYYFINR